MQDLAIVSGAGRQVMINGTLYMVPKLTPSILGRINAWLKTVAPNPKDEAKERMQGLPDAVALEIWRDAVQEAKQWPPTFGSEWGTQLILNYDGATVVVYEVLSPANPSLTMEQARQIVNMIGLQGLDKIIELASPEIQIPKKAGDDDPKAETTRQSGV